MTGRETGKQRAARVPLDYYKRGDRLGRLRGLLALGAFLGAVGWWATGLAWTRATPNRLTPLGSARASHGPLAHVHARWEGRCDACHVPFTAIDGTAWSPLPASDPHAADAKCLECHRDAGPHSDREIATEVRSCASCHRDHRGRDVSLSAVPDADCTRCHADLNGHRTGGKTGADVRAGITAFTAKAHPEFSAVGEGKRAPGTIRFDHAVHLAPGMNPAEKGRPLKRVGELATGDRERYRKAGQKDDAPVRLDCADCHRPDASGAYMAATTYEGDCRACHALDFDPSRPWATVRHGLQPEELRGELRRMVSERYLSERPEPARRVRARPMPGRGGGADDAEVRKAREAVDAGVAAAEAFLFDGRRCGECHRVKDDAGKRPARIDPAGLVAVRMPRARFDHAAHRAVADCASCHAKAAVSRSAQDVLLPGRDSCVECHAPARVSGERLIGGAGWSCTECHGYHRRGVKDRVAAAGVGAGDRLRDYLAEVAAEDKAAP